MNKENLNINCNISIKGRYNLLVKHGDGTTTETGFFNNLILDIGLDRLGGDGISPMQVCYVGTSSTPPTNTQTGLIAAIGGASGSNNRVSQVNNGAGSNYTATCTWSFSFNVGQIVGTIAEVGVGSTGGATNLLSRALILDGSGNPTTITLLATDQLIVYYQVILTPVLTDSTGTFNISGTPYNYTIRPYSITTFGSTGYLLTYSDYVCKLYGYTPYAAGCTLGPITSSSGLIGTAGSNSTSIASFGTYTAGTYTRTSTFVIAPANNNLAGGIGGFIFNYGGPYQEARWQVVFNNPIPKNSINQLTMTFSISWSR